MTVPGEPRESDDIVLVDDEPMVAEFVRRVLRGSGRRLLAFHDPFRALEHLTGHAPAVLLVDTRMPGMDGPELLAQLAARGRLFDTRVILCSASRHRDGGEAPIGLPRLEWLSKDELLDRHTLLARLGGPEPVGLAVQPSSAADSSGSASNRSATRP